MRVRLVPKTMYEVFTEEGESLDNFVESSQWEGMTKLYSATSVVDQIIVESEFSFASMLFGRNKQPRVEIVVKMSSRLLDMVRAKETDKESQGGREVRPSGKQPQDG